MKKTKILLIGKNGQIGSSIKKRLSKINKNIICLSKKELNLENLLSIQKKLNKIKPEIIINAAAYTKVDEVVQKNGVTILGEKNILNKLPVSASNLYAKNLFNFVLNLYDKKTNKININLEDEIINKTLVK